MSAVEIRFRIADECSEWEPELVRTRASGEVPTAVRRITELRRRNPEAAIAIERRGDSRSPNPSPYVRFRIKNGEELRYSRMVHLDEKEEILEQIRESFPKAEITEVKA